MFAEDISAFKALPSTLDTLISNMETQLPLMAQRRTKIRLNPEKLPSLAESDKFDKANSPAFAWIYWFDPVCFYTKILETPSISQNIRFGFAHFVDEPTELYHSAS